MRKRRYGVSGLDVLCAQESIASFLPPSIGSLVRVALVGKRGVFADTRVERTGAGGYAWRG